VSVCESGSAGEARRGHAVRVERRAGPRGRRDNVGVRVACAGWGSREGDGGRAALALSGTSPLAAAGVAVYLAVAAGQPQPAWAYEWDEAPAAGVSGMEAQILGGSIGVQRGGDPGVAGGNSPPAAEVAAEASDPDPGSGSGEDSGPADTEEARLAAYNKRIQTLNRVPEGFPVFVRNGYNVKVENVESYVTTPSGLLAFDFSLGDEGRAPAVDGQKVVFHYTAYNENGRRIDSSYKQDRPVDQIVGIGGMIPGFEEGITGMHVGGKRRIVVPPELGPPTGPATFFSAKQYEIFDIELLDILSCAREGLVFSKVVCK